MKHLTALIALLFALLPLQAQHGALFAQSTNTDTERDTTVIMNQAPSPLVSAGTTLTINATGEIVVPADQVNLQINITVTGLSPETVFDDHRARENALVELIHERGIDTNNLRFQPMNISSYVARENMNGTAVREYRTNQSVSLTLNDFDLFEEIQVFLIENGFDNFSGRFSSSRIEEVEPDALVLALENAHQKAEIIAQSFGMDVKNVLSVEHGAMPITRQDSPEMAMFRTADSSSLMEFEQQVRVRSTVTVEFLVN